MKHDTVSILCQCSGQSEFCGHRITISVERDAVRLEVEKPGPIFIRQPGAIDIIIEFLKEFMDETEDCPVCKEDEKGNV